MSSRNENQGLGARIRVTTYDADLSDKVEGFLDEVHASERCTCIGFNSKTCICLEKPKDPPGFATPKPGTGKVLEHPLPLTQEHQDPSKWAPTHRTFESGSVRDNDDDKPLPMELNPYMLIRYGYHMKYGQMRYGDSNWELGQTDVEIWRSMSRHFMQAYMNFKFPNASKATDDGTDHLSALLFGINMLMHNECNNDIEADKYFKSRE